MSALDVAIAAVRTRQASPAQLHDVADAAESCATTDQEKHLVGLAQAALLFMRSSRTLPVDESVWSAVEDVVALAERAQVSQQETRRQVVGSKGDMYWLDRAVGARWSRCTCKGFTFWTPTAKRSVRGCTHLDEANRAPAFVPASTLPAGSFFDPSLVFNARGAA